jgi:hypothetical protein
MAGSCLIYPTNNNNIFSNGFELFKQCSIAHNISHH